MTISNTATHNKSNQNAAAEQIIHLKLAQTSQSSFGSTSVHALLNERIRVKFGPAFEQIVNAHKFHRGLEVLEGSSDKTVINSFMHAGTLLMTLSKKGDANDNITFIADQRTDKKGYRLGNIYTGHGSEKRFAEMIDDVTKKLETAPEETLQPSTDPFPKMPNFK